jgi:hypothetical protein
MPAAIIAASPVPNSQSPITRTTNVLGLTFQFDSPADQDVLGTLSAGRNHLPITDMF